MDGSGKQQYAGILVGLGLVIAGLFGGILIMLLVGNPGQPSHTEFRLVEQVDLYEAGRDSLHGSRIAGALELNEVFKEVASRVTAAVVSIEGIGGWREMARESVGSGVAISPQGYVVTNFHVVDNTSSFRVTFTSKAEYGARVVGVDESTDLAVLKLDMPPDEEVPVLVVGDSDEVVAGEWVLAIGNPFRLNSTVTAGIVSALGRRVNLFEREFSIEDFIQTDAAINPGNSGGALVNLNGELVGISTAIATESGTYEGYGFAIPSSLVMRVVQDLIAYGEVKRGYLGVSLADVNASRAGSLGLDSIKGVFLNSVERGGAADRGGLRVDDVILSVDGRTVNEINVLQSIIARRRPGDMVAMEVWRAGETRQLVIELMGKDDPATHDWLASFSSVPNAAPETPADTYHMGAWGLLVRELESWELEEFGAENGIYVSYVLEGSVSSAAGVPTGVLLESIDGQRISKVEDLQRLLREPAERGDPVAFLIRRRGGLTNSIEIAPPAR